jgi:hypothetical protein
MMEFEILLGPGSLVIFLCSFFARDREVRHALLIASGWLFLLFVVCIVILKYAPQ